MVRVLDGLLWRFKQMLTQHTRTNTLWPQIAQDNAGEKSFYDKKQCLDKIMAKDNMEIGGCGTLWGDRSEANEWLGGTNPATGQLEVNPDDEAMYRYINCLNVITKLTVVKKVVSVIPKPKTFPILLLVKHNVSVVVKILTYR